ncbi:YWFCY domain-containing protein [Spirosoma luteum]|uniref:YWFCY domain-containing protein n=1 Tax=Spirosoma luteum TaxID=431553 RepID=UPI00037C1005|nr:YWFCY domain-containing protein [Spirosoma luteum]
MSQTEHDKDYRGILNTILYFGFAILLFHLYVFCHNVFTKLGIPLSILTNIIRSLNDVTHLFNNTWASKLAALAILILYCFGNKSKKDIGATWSEVYYLALAGLFFYFGNFLLLDMRQLNVDTINILYTVTTFGGYLLLMKAGSKATSIIPITIGNDAFNEVNESFMQETELIENEYSINIPTLFTYKQKVHQGWINVVNAFRATMVLGTPGSGKSYAVVNNYIRQMIEKGFCLFIYDFKFPDLSRIAYFYLQKNKDVYQKLYGKIPQFYIINFDDPRRSHRCNPLLPELMTDIIDAQEASSAILLNLNKVWIQKSGEFFVESPISFLTACIWYLKRYNDRKVEEYLDTLSEEQRNEPRVTDHINYCTLPHVIEFACHQYDEIFPIMKAEPELDLVIEPFFSALKNDAKEQLEGQIASARIPLSRMASPTLYWVMTGNDFSLDINDPNDPKILCVGNNPDRQSVYGAALGLYASRLIKLINKKDRIKCGFIIDELPTVLLRGLDNLIATGRSNKVAVVLGLQDLSQLIRDYGREVANAIFTTIGNIFTGQVKGETAKNLSSSFGKNVQQRQSFNITDKETTTNLSTQMDSVIPESKLSNLSQGRFAGAIADNVDQEVKQKMFHAKIVISKTMEKELKQLPQIPPLPHYQQFSDQQIRFMVDNQYKQVKQDVRNIIAEQLGVIRTGSDSHLLRGLVTANPNYLMDSIQEPVNA